VSNISEKCDLRIISNDTSDGSGLILCPKTFLWQPELWASLYASAFFTSGAPSLPIAGYYCDETCSTFPVPAGYYLHMCRLFYVDERREYAVDHNTPRSSGHSQLFATEHSICNVYSNCMNIIIHQENSQHSMALPGQGALLGIGYKCICREGLFNKQVYPVKCGSQGIEIAFFLTENVDLQGSSAQELNQNTGSDTRSHDNATTSNGSNTTRAAAPPLRSSRSITSTILALQRIKMRLSICEHCQYHRVVPVLFLSGIRHPCLRYIVK